MQDRDTLGGVRGQFGPAFCTRCREEMPPEGRYGWSYINEKEADLLTMVRQTGSLQRMIDDLKAEIGRDNHEGMVLTEHRQQLALEEARRRSSLSDIETTRGQMEELDLMSVAASSSAVMEGDEQYSGDEF